MIKNEYRFQCLLTSLQSCTETSRAVFPMARSPGTKFTLTTDRPRERSFRSRRCTGETRSWSGTIRSLCLVFECTQGDSAGNDETPASPGGRFCIQECRSTRAMKIGHAENTFKHAKHAEYTFLLRRLSPTKNRNADDESPDYSLTSPNLGTFRWWGHENLRTTTHGPERSLHMHKGRYQGIKGITLIPIIFWFGLGDLVLYFLIDLSIPVV
jgi:hypothetical protein